MTSLADITPGLSAINNQISNTAYNQNASQGVVAGPVNPNSGYKQPTAPVNNYAPAGGSQPTASVSQNTQSSPPLQSQPQAPSINFDALIAPAIQGLESAIGGYQSANQDILSGIQSDKGVQEGKINQSTQDQTNTINQAKDTQNTNANNAIDQARQQYSEIQQGIQARYGGTTGTGAFATELAGRGAMQNIGQIRQAAAGYVKQFDDKLAQVQQVGQLAIQDAETNAQKLTAQAKDNLAQEIAGIRSQQSTLQSQKAQLYANAYQIYQQKVAEVDAQNTQFKQQLYVQQKAAEQALQSAQQRAQQIASTANPVDLHNLIMQADQIKQAGYTPTVDLSAKGTGSLSFTSPNNQAGGLSADQTLQQLGLQ